MTVVLLFSLVLFVCFFFLRLSFCHTLLMKQMNLFTAEPPSFHNVPKSLKVKRGTSLEMDIQVCGFPLPKKVFWFKDGNELHGSRRTIMQYVDGTTKLLIHETIFDDSGSYECYTENAHGNNKCKIPVKVTKVRGNFSKKSLKIKGNSVLLFLKYLI